MRIVSNPEIRPAKCAVLPYVSGFREGGYVDTGSEMEPSPMPSRVYVSVQAVGELGKVVGLIPADVHAETVDALDEANRRILDLEEEVAQADRQLDAVHTLRRSGYSTGAKPGRKPKEPVEA